MNIKELVKTEGPNYLIDRGVELSFVEMDDFLIDLYNFSESNFIRFLKNSSYKGGKPIDFQDDYVIYNTLDPTEGGVSLEDKYLFNFITKVMEDNNLKREDFLNYCRDLGYDV